MMPNDVKARWESLRDPMSELQLYALVDGAQYEAHTGKRLQTAGGLFPLFAGTPDAALAHAGPWLVDANRVGDALGEELVKLERDAPSLTWLISPQDVRGLGQMLQLNLNVRLPDGRHALLRFWDPRVLRVLAQTLDDAQRKNFFGHIYEWHLLHEGRRIWIGRQRADAH